MESRIYEYDGREYRIEQSGKCSAEMEPLTPEADDGFPSVVMIVQPGIKSATDPRPYIIVETNDFGGNTADQPQPQLIHAHSWDEAAQKGAVMLQTKKPDPNPLCRGMHDFLKGGDAGEHPMGCRVGMSTNPQERIDYWKRKEGHTGGKILVSGLTYDEAQKREVKAAKKRGCVLAFCGPRNGLRNWSVYRVWGGNCPSRKWS